MKRSRFSKYLSMGLMIIAVMMFAGVSLASDGEREREYGDKVYAASFVPCVAALCGADSTATLERGRVKVRINGEVTLHLHESSFLNTPLTLIYQPFNAAAVTVGTFITDERGSVDCDDDNPNPIGILNIADTMGMFIISDGISTNYYVTAFSTFPDVPAPAKNEFDDARDMNELKQMYKQKNTLTTQSVNLQKKALAGSLVETKAKLKQDYKAKAATLPR